MIKKAFGGAAIVSRSDLEQLNTDQNQAAGALLAAVSELCLPGCRGFGRSGTLPHHSMELAKLPFRSSPWLGAVRALAALVARRSADGRTAWVKRALKSGMTTAAL